MDSVFSYAARKLERVFGKPHFLKKFAGGRVEVERPDAFRIIHCYGLKSVAPFH